MKYYAWPQNRGFGDRPARCLRHSNELRVRDNLAITPADAYEMAKQGIPISSQNRADVIFTETTSNIPAELDIMDQRGVDIADVWEAQMISRQRVKNAKFHGKGDTSSDNPLL